MATGLAIAALAASSFLIGYIGGTFLFGRRDGDG